MVGREIVIATEMMAGMADMVGEEVVEVDGEEGEAEVDVTAAEGIDLQSGWMKYWGAREEDYEKRRPILYCTLCGVQYCQDGIPLEP